MRHHFDKSQVYELSSDKLSVLAIFGNGYLKSLIRHEQARRAQVCERMRRAQADQMGRVFDGYSARAA